MIFIRSKKLEIAKAFWAGETHRELQKRFIEEFAVIEPKARRRDPPLHQKTKVDE
jgi:hypothetical protein